MRHHSQSRTLTRAPVSCAAMWQMMSQGTLPVDGSAPVARPGLLIALVLMYPLLTILGMVLIIPLVMYVTDHAPFQSLNMLRPDHFIQLVVQVYRAWLSSAGGKLKPKDL